MIHIYHNMICAHILAADTVKKVYLLLYNGVQWAGFILIVMSLLKCLPKGRGVSLQFRVAKVSILVQQVACAFGLVIQCHTASFMQSSIFIVLKFYGKLSSCSVSKLLQKS